MRSAPILALFALAALLVGSAAAQKTAPPPQKPSPSAMKQARKAFRDGQRAEQRGDWPLAFDHYSHAAADWPANLDYKLRESLARFHLVQERVNAAERDAAAGRLASARQELGAALALEPGYPIARQRLAQIDQMLAHRSPIERKAIGKMPQVKPAPGVRSFDYRGDTEGAYQEIARQFAVAVAFDPELPHRRIRFRVKDVDFPTALRLVGQMTGTFWRPLGPRLFFVAANTPAKVREYGPSIQRTLLLAASQTPSEMEQTTRIIRDIAGLRQTQLDVGAHTLLLRGAPDQVALAAQLAREIEQPRGEILLELDILEVDRNLARQLGITPPSSATAYTVSPSQIEQAQQSAQGLIDVLTQIFGQPSALAGLSTGQIQALAGAGQLSAATLVPPLVAFGGGKSTFFATLPGAVAQLAETLNLVRSGQHMLLRAEDGEPSSFFVGDRFPVSLASLSSSLTSPALVPQVGAAQFPRSDFPTGMKPVAVAAADFNGDTFADLAVANQDDNTVSVLLNNGSGSFSPGQVIDVQAAPSAVVTGDFNGDGNVDLAVAARDANLVSILGGNGDGTFSLIREIAVDKSPVAIATGDFDGDGHLDLAVVNRDANTVSLLLGNGDGSFQPQFEIPVGATPVALATGDFNADGSLDLAVVDQNDNAVLVLLGNGDGTFRRGSSFATGDTPTGVAAADFSGDTKVDLAVANQNDNTVSLLLGNGDGSFQSKIDFQAGNGPVAIVAADFNLDGVADLAVADENDNQVSVLVNNGQGDFGIRLPVDTGNSPDALASADFDKNGFQDLAAANQVDNTVSVILNDISLVPGSQVAGQIPYPGFQFVDLGLKVTMTPRLHPNGDVTLKMKVEIHGLTPQDVNGIPILTSRSFEQVVRLKEGQPTLLASALQPRESLTLTGWPGLASLAARNRTTQDTELVVIARPRLVRLPRHQARTIFAGIGRGQP
jgi:ankyrin repeat protein